MKTKTAIKAIVTGTVATVLLFTACKKAETGPKGDTGPTGANGVVTSSTDGYIKGNVSGMRKDGTVFNEAYNYVYYFGGQSGDLDSLATNLYNFNLTRGGNDILGYNYANIDVLVSSKAATTGTLGIYFNFEKPLGTNKLFQFSTSGTVTTPVSGLAYNATTGVYTGTFNCSVPALGNSSGNLATITGSFQATMTQIYNKTANMGAFIKD